MTVVYSIAFEARSPQRVANVSVALRHGLRALAHNPVIRATGLAATLAGFGWGLMAVGFPLYAVAILRSPAHTGGYLWAAVGLGSILGTFVLRGAPTLRRVGLSYAVLSLSALLWPLAGGLAAGILPITLTGFLEGPAFSGSIALRQRHCPPEVRAQLMTTVSGIIMVAARPARRSAEPFTGPWR